MRIVIRIATKIYSLGPRATPAAPKISSQSVQNFLSKQTNKQTDPKTLPPFQAEKMGRYLRPLEEENVVQFLKG